MKKCLTMLCAVVLVLLYAVPALAASGNVTYDADAGSFIFTPGSVYSPTDLFLKLKEVMPGDCITQTITVKNDASNGVKVKIYMRSLGAHDGSEDFLSQLRLRVEKHEVNSMAYMFDAAASETAQLTDWVYLGMLYSGGEVNLNVILDVPTTLGNEFQQQAGYLDWEFKVEEYEIEPGDPTPPPTGDDFQIWIWVGLMFMSLCAIMIFILAWKRKDEDS